MDAGMNLRITPVLHSVPLDPVRVDKECPPLDPVELLSTQQARDMTRRMRRCVHVYGQELGNIELLDRLPHAHPLMTTNGFQVPMMDPLLSQNPIP
jgi:hypothetical protein